MPFITRNENGKIKAAFTCRQLAGQEWVDDEDAEYLLMLQLNYANAEQEALIQAKIREQAIAELKKEGKL